MTERIDWIDYAKGIGIILVVYAHLLSSGYNAGLAIPAHFFQFSDSLVYSFHMPLFFFLAGLLVEESFAARGQQGFLLSKFRLIAYPYLVWSFLQAGAEIIFSQHSSRGVILEDLPLIPFLPLAQFWFLYALLWMYLVYGLFRLLGKLSLYLLVVCAGLLFFFPIKTDIMALGGFSTGFLYFVTGVLLKKTRTDLQSFVLPLWLSLVLFLVFIASGYYVFANIIEPVRLPGGAHPFLFILLAFLGIGFSIGLAHFFVGKDFFRPIRLLGIYSYEIYLVHMLAGVGARVVLTQFLQIENGIVHMCVGVTAGLLLPIALYKFSQKLNFPYLFNPFRLSVRETPSSG
jgi:fucose 4-O-acetylase-like acetyltransferase